MLIVSDMLWFRANSLATTYSPRARNWAMRPTGSVREEHLEQKKFWEPIESAVEKTGDAAVLRFQHAFIDWDAIRGKKGPMDPRVDS